MKVRELTFNEQLRGIHVLLKETSKRIEEVLLSPLPVFIEYPGDVPLLVRPDAVPAPGKEMVNEMFLKESTISIILAALCAYRGDKLERAKSAWRGYSPAEMREKYGQSGETRQEILDGYQRHVDAVESAIADVRKAAGYGD